MKLGKLVEIDKIVVVLVNLWHYATHFVQRRSRPQRMENILQLVVWDLPISIFVKLFEFLLDLSYVPQKISLRITIVQIKPFCWTCWISSWPRPCSLENFLENNYTSDQAKLALQSHYRSNWLIRTTPLYCSRSKHLIKWESDWHAWRLHNWCSQFCCSL